MYMLPEMRLVSSCWWGVGDTGMPCGQQFPRLRSVRIHTYVRAYLRAPIVFWGWIFAADVDAAWYGTIRCDTISISEGAHSQRSCGRDFRSQLYARECARRMEKTSCRVCIWLASEGRRSLRPYRIGSRNCDSLRVIPPPARAETASRDVTDCHSPSYNHSHMPPPIEC